MPKPAARLVIRIGTKRVGLASRTPHLVRAALSQQVRVVDQKDTVFHDDTDQSSSPMNA
jgi:hypothetical protein